MMDFLFYLFAFLTQLMTEHADLFESMGNRMFRSFAIILIVWFGVKSALAFRSFSTHTDDASALEKKIDNFVLHAERESRKSFRLAGEEIQEVPLRHEGDKFANSW